MSGARGARAIALAGVLLAALAAALAGYAAASAWRERLPLAALLGPARYALGIALPVAFALACVLGIGRARALVRPEPALPGLRDLRFAFCAAVLAVAFVLFDLQPPRRLPVLLVFGVAAGVFPALALIAQALERSGRARAARRLDFATFQLALAPLLLEGGLRLFAAVHPVPLLVGGEAGPERFIAAYRMQPGSMHIGHRVNSRGFNDQELARRPGDVLVGNIGDSFSVGVVPFPMHFTSVCERAVPDLVIDNVGVSAIGPPEYLQLLRAEVLPRDPDAVVIDVFVGNDIGFFQEVDREAGATPLPSGLRRDRWIALRAWDRSRAVASERVRRGGSGPGRLQGEGNDEERIVATPEEAARVYPWTVDPLLELPTMSPEAHAALKLAIAQGVLRSVPDSYPRFFDALQRIVDAAGSVPLYVMILPDEMQVDDAIWSEVKALPGGTTFDRDLPQRRIEAWLAERGIQVVDPLPALRAAAPWSDGRPHLYHARDTHLNARGNAIVGAVLADALRPLVERLHAERAGR